MTEVAGGKLIAVPFDPTRGDPERITRILDHMASHAGWFASNETPEEARVNALWMMAQEDHWKYEMYNGGTFAGMLLVHRITPKVDALFHFTLLPSKETGATLFGSRKLVWNFLGHVFDQFQLQRISVEIPEHQPKLIHWFRQRLGFRYEGENDTARLAKNRAVLKLEVPGIPAWVAAQGSRREHAHWDGTKWQDLVLLRILRTEYEARASLGTTPHATRETTPEVSDVPASEARTIPAATAAGSG